MSTKRRSSKRGTSPLRASVILERQGACVRVDDVPVAEAFAVLGELLDAMREAVKVYPELTVELAPVAGYSPLDVREDDYEQGRRIGFRPAR